ncbi:MAG: helix-turn-helix domain-containing protein [Anaerolineae bacterium]|nr:helix-turn-helix domain-containing protein [Anaerolineae bacterium]MCO5191537.1 helix-turn-helix domain-containing protein [Anaerolineae bacterium]MCO5194548.1 helix-turn-helix domain-containing protein [Anaerolineae bacterium]MCO5199621.1 helix-turn-helix domain-containing protein [Anaerolineae bacterium]MCO5206475.1 helix-turn-helix domain-containing protein [Anaerolineae bacterium]
MADKLKVADLAERWEKSEYTVRRYIRSGKLKIAGYDGVGPRAGYLIDKKEVERFEREVMKRT